MHGGITAVTNDKMIQHNYDINLHNKFNKYHIADNDLISISQHSQLRINMKKYAKIYTNDVEIAESINLLNNTRINPMKRLKYKRELMRYVRDRYCDDNELIECIVELINQTDIMTHFDQYFTYNS